MARIQSISDPDYVDSQYRNSDNLNARIRLHQECSTNKYGWQRWIFDKFSFEPQAHILELGCGAGNLWLENLVRISEGLNIVLSDHSAGMVEQARENLGDVIPTLQFNVIDAQYIPFETDSFDILIANHMLYHLPDMEKGLAEIRRVLKPTGYFYATTIGCHHLKELEDLISRFDARLSSWGQLPTDSFTLETGASILGNYFENVSIDRYSDSFLVSDVKLLVDYVFSGRLELTPDQRENLAQFIEQAMLSQQDKIHITKDSGIFLATGVK